MAKRQDTGVWPRAPPWNRPTCGPWTVAHGADVDVDDLALLGDRPEGVAPPPRDADVGLVDRPPSADAPSVRPCRVLIARGELLRPVDDGRGIDVDSAFGQEPGDVGIRQTEAHIPLPGRERRPRRVRIDRRQEVGHIARGSGKYQPDPILSTHREHAGQHGDHRPQTRALRPGAYAVLGAVSASSAPRARSAARCAAVTPVRPVMSRRS
jgi:hypothetical protein